MAGSSPCYLAGVRFSTISSALGWVCCGGAYGLASVGQPIQFFVEYSAPIGAAAVGIMGACSTKIFWRRCIALVRVGSSLALAYSFRAAVASSFLKRPKLPAWELLPTGWR